MTNKKKTAKKKPIAHEVECLDPDDLYPDDDDDDFDLGAIAGATFDYEDFKRDQTQCLELRDAVRMLLNLGDLGEHYWKENGKEKYDKVYRRARNDIAANVLDSIEAQEPFRVDLLKWKTWAIESNQEIPEEMNEILSNNEQDGPKKRRSREITRLAEKTYLAIRTLDHDPSNSEVYAALKDYDDDEILKGKPDAEKIYFQHRGSITRKSFDNTMTTIRNKEPVTT